MTNLILPSRRRFLFMAPAIVAASSLMPGHSIARLLPHERFWHSTLPLMGLGTVRHREISKAEYDRLVMSGAQGLTVWASHLWRHEP